MAAIRLSLGLSETRCRALYIWIIAQAPNASHSVQITEEAVRDVGSTVEKRDR